MTKDQAKQAIRTLLVEKKVYKNSLAYKTAMDAIENAGTKTPCGSNAGSGRYASSKSWQTETARVFNLAGVPFSVGNNAPRGGKNGDYVIVNL